MLYEDELQKIVNRLKQIRKAKGLTIQELAYRCDIERSNISRIEGGKNYITLKTLCKICNALDVKWEDVFINDSML